MNNPEIINLNSNLTEEISINTSSGASLGGGVASTVSPGVSLPNRSANLGPGVELLMNESKKVSGSSGDKESNLGSLRELEFELNNLTNGGEAKKNKLEEEEKAFATLPSLSGNSLRQSSDGVKNITSDQPFTVKFNKQDTDIKLPVNNINIGKSTVENEQNNKKTWDGFNKFNDVPIDPNMQSATAEPQMTKEDMVRKKFEILRKLESLEKKGVKLSRRYTMESSLLEMEGEYEMIVSEKKKSSSIKFQGKMLMACITGLEFLNNKVDPFDIKLDGWGDQVNENLDDYDDIFAELHEKYKSKAKWAPEVKLLFQLGGGAIMLHMTNSMFQSSMPGIDDIMRQNPDLMRNFTQAAASSMSSTNPGFSGFMSNIMTDENNPGMGDQDVPGRDVPGQDMADVGGINIQETYTNTNKHVEKSFQRPTESDINKTKKRNEMSGPSDISDILSNIKKTTTGLRNGNAHARDNDNDSTISISELKEIQGSLDKNSMAKRSKRKTSNKNNVIQLDV
jgi:hypothetical protein